MHDLIPQAIFYVFAGLTTLSAIMVITQSNPVRSVLFLVVAFFTSAVLWILIDAEFLALILVLVYVGAVMTLFLFVVMMLNIDVESVKKKLLSYMTVGLAIIVLLVGLLVQVMPTKLFDGVKSTIEHAQSGTLASVNQNTATLSNTEALGMVLYTDYVFAFELAAMILLVAIIAAITLVHRKPARSKRQNIVQQIMTRPKERVKLVKMKAERS